MPDDMITAYARVGGAPAVRAVVDRFYERVLADAELRPYFAGLDADALAGLRRHQVAMVSQVLGGPREYTGRELGEAHQGLAITDHAYRRVMHLLVGTLWEFQVPEDIIFDVGELLASLRTVIAAGEPASAEAA